MSTETPIKKPRYSKPSGEQWEAMSISQRALYSQWLARRVFRARELLQEACATRWYMIAIEEYWVRELGEKMTPADKKAMRAVTGGNTPPDREYLVEHYEAAVHYHRNLRGMPRIELPETLPE